MAKEQNARLKSNNTHDLYQPWIKTYPDGIDFHAQLDTTPIPFKLDQAIAAYQSDVALDFMGQETTFAQLGMEINAFAGALQKQLGLQKGDRIALLLPNCPFFPIAYYAALKIGAIIVNCNPLYTKHELLHILKKADVKYIITADLKLTFEKAEALVRENCAKGIIVSHFPNALPTFKRTVYKLFKSGDLSKPARSSISEKVHEYEHMRHQGHQAEPVDLSPSDIAILQFTGGTTGSPKAAMLTHSNIAANVSQTNIWGVDLFQKPNSVVAVLPFFHIFAMTVCMNLPLTNGLKVVMLPRFEKKQLLQLVHRTKPTIFPSVPTLAHAVATAPERKTYDISSIKAGISGGAALPLETKQAFKDATGGRVVEGYGLSETSPVLCCGPLHAPNKDHSIGQPLPGTDVQFVDLNDPSKFVAPGERGELVAKGPQVMAGYLDDPKATDNAFTNGYFRTGDVGYMDEDGHVYIVDRIKDLIICSGFNVYPRKIEDALYKHDKVDECNVIGVKDNYRGEAPVAFIKLKHGQTATQDEVIAFLKTYLSKIEMPKEIIFKDELPKTLIGKLSKKELRELYNG